MTGAVLVAGATSGAGKSTVVAALGRSLARRGSSVAPFKAQNMSNHAAVTADGGEIGRAQAMQAAACGVAPERAMNPVLLKPGDRARSHVIVKGAAAGSTDAHAWGATTTDLRPVVLEALGSLRRRFDTVVAEGAGGAAEINLLQRDLVNLPLAAAAGMPALLVVDIERGGAFAAAHGTIDLLPPPLRAPIAGVLFNRFRGDPTLLDDGIRALEQRHGPPVLGVLDHLGDDPLFGVEDSLDLVHSLAQPGERSSTNPLRIGVVGLPKLANPSDFDPLVAEPDVVLQWVHHAGQVRDADVLVVPGSRATLSDLRWLRERGLADAIVDAANRGTSVVGICAGAQILGRRIVDPVEGDGDERGLGLTDAETAFEQDKVVAQRTGHTPDGAPVAGYQIHHGRVRSATPWLMLDGRHPNVANTSPGDPDGAIGTAPGTWVRSTTLHGIFDADAVRGALLSEWADRHQRQVTPTTVAFADRLEAQHERLADWLEGAVDVGTVAEIARRAVPPGDEPGWPLWS